MPKHYPFENRTQFDGNFPADFIAEGLTRRAAGSTRFTRAVRRRCSGKSAFRKCHRHGIILRRAAKKLSKRLKNYAPPEEVLGQARRGRAGVSFSLNSPAVKAGRPAVLGKRRARGVARRFCCLFCECVFFFCDIQQTFDGWQPKQNANRTVNMN